MHTRSAAAHVSGAKTLKIHTSGQYQDAEGQTSCKVCPKGKYIGGTSSMDVAASVWGRRLQNCADDDACLHAKSRWNSNSNCAASVHLCTGIVYMEDMQECCPQTCGE
jgi:hypothetical protein